MLFLSGNSFLLFLASAGLSSFVSAEGLRKSISSPEDAVQRSTPFFSSLFGKNNDRTLSSMHYSQMGIDVEGSTTDDNLGKSILMSKDGLRIAVSAPGASMGKGVTKIFDWDALLEEWVQVGQDIIGPTMKIYLGWSLDMNDDGSRIVLGAPEAHDDDGCMRVYELDNNNTWQAIGEEILPPSETKGQAGVSVTMNALGDRVAFGAPRANNYSGTVTAFEFINESWVAMGQAIDGELSNYYYYDYSGASIAMDASGSRLVVGGRLGSLTKGHIKIYDYEGESGWILNSQIDGADYYDRFGGDVDINEDGTRIIVGAFTSDGQSNKEDSGEVYVFDYDGTSWTRVGQTINGSAKKDRLGESVAISGDGTHIAFSSPENDENGNNAGKIEVYKFSEASQSWEPQGNDIFGECAGDKVGEGGGSIAMDRTGAHIAFGAQRGKYYAGMIRVYEALAGEGDGTNGSTNNCA